MMLRDRLATVFGVGHTLYMPGTAASMLALSLAIFLVSTVGHWLVWLCALVLLWIGFRASAAYAEAYAKWDARECVIDEFAAVFVIACLMPLFLPSWIVALIVFRIFDICKPWPIPEAEKLMEPGARVMIDDLLAALPAIVAGWLVYFASLIWCIPSLNTQSGFAE